jgi:histidinol phosphatase-like enzyme (inositol monophosphatase family)
MTAVDDATIAFAHRLADAAGDVIRPYFRARIDIANKHKTAGFDPVTEADRGAEEAIRALVARERPHDGILGEEFGETKGKSGWRWVLDPVDGTRAFITGRHEWGSLIALEHDGVPVLGIIDQPVLRERFIGVNGRAAMRSSGEVVPLHGRSCSELSQAVLCATHPDAYFTEAERIAFKRLEKHVRMARFGGDCYLFAMLALGFMDIIVESTLNRWDVAALIPLVEGAGGRITNWQGGPCLNGGQVIAVGDPELHAKVIAILNE